MYPILLRLGSLTIYAYGFFVILGFAIGTVFAIWRAKKIGISIPFERLVDLFFYSVLSAIVGSRILYGLLHFDFYRKNPFKIFNLSEGGLVFYGGLLLALGISILYMKRHQMPVWRLADLVSPSLAIGLFFGRLGCFFAGCCYGRETSLPWAIVFKDPNSLAPLNISLHPVQIYEAGMGLVLFFFLIWKEKGKRFEGETFWLFILLYSIGRFFIEMVRGDPRGFFLGDLLSTSQGIGVFLVILSLFMLFYLKRRPRSHHGCLRNIEIPPPPPEKAKQGS